MNHLGLFEGIGGFSLAAHWMGWKTVAWCEWNEFGQRVLKYHFPKAIGHGDITKTDFTPYANKIDILTGGFPCQPYSSAGKRRGKDDDRHLWPQMLRSIREIAPRYIVGENVLGLVNWNGGLVFDEVCADLEAEGYEVAPVVIPAAAKNAPHGRDRVWFIARRTTPDTESDGGTVSKLAKSQGIKQLQAKPNLNRHEELGPTTDTDSDGQHQRHSGNEVNASQGGVNAQRDVEQGNDDGNAPDTECTRLEYGSQTGNLRSEETKTRREGSQFTNEFTPNGDGDWNAPDTGSGGISGHRGRCENGEFQTNEFNKNYRKRQPRMDWEQFPTQSPVCGGDDGLSRELDGITFPKWRAESIKAYGNAIVPQVAFEIFKTIELYEKGL